MLDEDVEKREPLCTISWYMWKTVWRILKKLKIELPYDTAISLQRIYPKELKSGSQRDICISMFIAALFTIAKTWKQPVCHQQMNR